MVSDGSLIVAVVVAVWNVGSVRSASKVRFWF